MKANLVMRLAMWLVERGSVDAAEEAFAGDLLEYFAHGRSSWWCLAQALFKAAFSIEQRLRASLVPLWYCIPFVFLYPVWQQLFAASITHQLMRYRGAVPWPGSAVLDITVGLIPAAIFIWMGILVYLLLRRQTFRDVDPVSTLFSLNVGTGLLSGEVLLRLGSSHHDLRALSRADFYYPLVHARFSLLLFSSLFVAIAMLPRERRPTHRYRELRRLRDRRNVLHLMRRFGVMELFQSLLRGRLKMRVAHNLLLLGGLIILAWPLTLRAQDATPRLMAADGRPMEFDVVSVRPDHSESAPMRIVSPPMSDGMTITNMPPEDILQWAFGLFLSDEIVGIPEWAKQERYDITAKVSDADAAAFHKVSDPIERTPMLQKILVERFGLKFHYEMKELPVYALVVGKSGSRMTEIQPAIGPNGMKDGGGRRLGPGQITSFGQPMKPLVDQLTKELGRVVVDRTGLRGYYNFTLKWTPDVGTAPAGGVPEDNSAPSIFTAVQEQLGLKLEATKSPVKVLVIDHLERPSAN